MIETARATRAMSANDEPPNFATDLMVERGYPVVRRRSAMHSSLRLVRPHIFDEVTFDFWVVSSLDSPPHRATVAVYEL